MGGACGTFGEKRDKCVFVAGKETHVDDLGVSRSAILNLWICLAQDTDKQRPVFNTVMTNKEFLCITRTVKHNYILPIITVRIQPMEPYYI